MVHAQRHLCAGLLVVSIQQCCYHGSTPGIEVEHVCTGLVREHFLEERDKLTTSPIMLQPHHASAPSCFSSIMLYPIMLQPIMLYPIMLQPIVDSVSSVVCTLPKHFFLWDGWCFVVCGVVC